MLNSKLLLQTLKIHPADTVTLSAFQDALEEEDQYEQVERVRELLAIEHKFRVEEANGVDHSDLDTNRRDFLRFVLGIREIRVGDRMCMDEWGRVYSVTRCAVGNTFVGFAQSAQEGDLVKVRLTWSMGIDAQADLKVSK